MGATSRTVTASFHMFTPGLRVVWKNDYHIYRQINRD